MIKQYKRNRYQEDDIFNTQNKWGHLEQLLENHVRLSLKDTILA